MNLRDSLTLSGIVLFGIYSWLRYLTRLGRPSAISKLPIAPLGEASFLWGHEYIIAKNEVNSEYSRWTQLLGPVYKIKAALFQKDIIIVADNLAVRHIFQNAYTYVKSQAYLPFIVKIVGRGVVWAEQDEHKFQRKLIAPAFAPSAVDEMADGVFRCVEKTISRLSADVEAAGGSGELNLSRYISSCTLEVIGHVGFGHDFSHDTPEAKAILNSWREDVLRFATFPAFVASVVIGVFPWIAKLPIAELHEDTTTKKVIHKVGRQLLQKPVDPNGKDIFSILVRESWIGKEMGSYGTSKTKLNDNQLLDNILSFFVAGFETSSGVIAFTLLDLAQNPDKQNKLREEILANELSPGTLENLLYLDAVAREGLRLHPSPHDTQRVALADDIIPLQKPVQLSDGRLMTSLPVKAGDVFTIPFTMINTDPEIWGCDANKFRPERWLEPNGVPQTKEAPHGPFSKVSSFADGPRMCIGWRLAVMQLKVVLATMIRSFEFRDSGKKIDKIMAPSLQPFVNGEPDQLPIHVSLLHDAK